MPISTITRTTQNMDHDIAHPNNPLFIHNAGLVIAAPFLIRYLQTLDMLQGRSFTNDEDKSRAVHLFQYLASGQSETPAHLLVFNKILCGLPLETPVSLGIELSEAEEEVSEQLLNSILQNWEMMKNSTIENLRGAFLLREGQLIEEETRWLLTVEPKAYDVTLDFLPWTISLVMLPWMDKRVEVVWRNTA